MCMHFTHIKNLRNRKMRALLLVTYSQMTILRYTIKSLSQCYESNASLNIIEFIELLHS